MENEVENGEIAYPGIVDQKTLSACLGTAEQLMRQSTPERVERFKRTKAKLIAQVKAHPLSFDEWNARATPTSPLTAGQAKDRAAEIIEVAYHNKAGEHVGYDERRMLELIASELTAVATETGWPDIESAPKDGRTILLGYYNSAGHWRTLRGQWFMDEQIAEWENGGDFEAGWYETSVENDDLPNVWPTNPTHWMLLPSPPESRKVLHCSCGAACTEVEYREHQSRGHDRVPTR